MVALLAQAVTITYQLQRRRCGRASCHTCHSGPGHGPYWYGNSRGDDKKLHATYIGKTLPPGASLSPLQQQRLSAWWAVQPSSSHLS
jgi:hypothetical protein